MSYRVQWSAWALDRLIKILDFIAEDRPSAAKHLVDEILARVEALEDYPRLGPVFSEDYGPYLRRLILGDHIVFYRVQESRRRISIITVRHARQRPLSLEDLLADERR